MRLVQVARRSTHALALAEAFAPEHLQLVGAQAEALAPRSRRAGCVFVGADSGDRVRRLHRRLEPHPADQRRRAVRLGAVAAHFRRTLHRGADRPTRTALARGRGAARPRRGLRAPRPVDGGAHSRQWRRDDPRRRDRPHDRRDRGPRQRSRSTATAPASATPASGSSTTCSTCSPATAGSTSTCTADGDLQTGAHHTVEDVGICIGQALDRALGDRAGIARYGARDGADGRGARRLRDRHLRARAAACSRRELPPGAIGNFDHELTEEFFRALAANARLTLHVTVEAGTNAHHMIEAAFKAVRARAARRGRDRPDRGGRPEHEGDADVSAPAAIAVVDYGMGNRRSVQKALEHVGARRAITSDHERAARRRRRWCVPGVGAFPRGDARTCASSGSIELLRERAGRGRAAARDLPRACSCCSTRSDGARARPTGSG